MKPKRFALELACCLLVIAVAELVFYLYSDNEFSLYIYFTSVIEVFVAPLHPGWSLIYPPFALIAIFGLLMLSARIAKAWVRVSLMLFLVTIWTALGFYTIVAYYQ